MSLGNDPMMIPAAHQLSNQSSPFVDSGVHLDLLTRSPSNVLAQHLQMSNEPDDDVFSHDSPGANDEVPLLTSSSSIDSSSSSNTTVVSDQSGVPSNGLCRSRRSHFSRKDSTPEMTNKVKTESESIAQLIKYLFSLIAASFRRTTHHSFDEVALVVLSELAAVQERATRSRKDPRKVPGHHSREGNWSDVDSQ